MLSVTLKRACMAIGVVVVGVKDKVRVRLGTGKQSRKEALVSVLLYEVVRKFKDILLICMNN